jgi:hypothetical protein
LTSDETGNLYIGDFGNNNHKRKKTINLKNYKCRLTFNTKVTVEKIRFKYPSVASNKKRYDAESFFYMDDNFYIFTKSRKKKNYGKVLLFKVPNKVGDHIAEYISEFTFCHESSCRITSATISKDGKKVVLLNHRSVLVFTGFKSDNFFSGNLKQLPFAHSSQKEGVCFKDATTLYITDEESIDSKGNLYTFSLF